MTLRSRKSKVVAKVLGPIKALVVKGVGATFRTKTALKTIKDLIKIQKNRTRGYPLGGKKLELAAKMAQDASKSDF